jgi:ribonuclease P protein component
VPLPARSPRLALPGEPHETHFSAEQTPSEQDPRVSGQDAHPRWTERPEAEARQGPAPHGTVLGGGWFPNGVSGRGGADSEPRSRLEPLPLEFSRVFREGRRLPGLNLVLYVRPTGERRRLGVTVGRRFGGAVARNRAKRRLREAFRRLVSRLRDQGDIVLVARPPALTVRFDELVSEMEALCAAGRLLAEDPDEAHR